MSSLSLPDNEIPYGTYEIEIGDSFDEQLASAPDFHILRCKF